MLVLAQNPRSRLELHWHDATHTLALRSDPVAEAAPMMPDAEALAEVLRSPEWIAPSPDATVGWLVERWCDRRALDALRHILEGWPNLGLTDGYAQLADALSHVRSLARRDLTPTEEELAGIAESTIRMMLRRRLG